MTLSQAGKTVFVATLDLLSMVRGRAIPESAFRDASNDGVGWVPANHVLCIDGDIRENPFGSCEDLRLVPDADTAVTIGAGTEHPTRLVLSSIRNMDGSPWEACPRAWLEATLEKLAETHGLSMVIGTEHEFYLLPDERATQPFSLTAFRGQQQVLDEILSELEVSNCEPETILPEYGRAQYELTCRPAPALRALDRAICVREIVRDTARRFGLTAVFSPTASHSAIGNGFHVHMSLQDKEGRNVTGDPADIAGLSDQARAFLSGLVRHGRALTAFASPSPVSYNRLVPHRWSSSYTTVGYRDRECMLRICPVYDSDPMRAVRRAHFEYRVPDATCNPYLLVAAMLTAGSEGLATPEDLSLSEGLDPEALSSGELMARGIARLPQSLDGALTALGTDQVLSAAVPPLLLQCYLIVKRDQAAKAVGQSAEDLIRYYERIY